MGANARPQVVMPSEVSSEVGVFDRFAEHAAQFASRATFFVFCVGLIVVWGPSILVIHRLSTWQLIVNTATTIITFLMVALLQNSQMRSDLALQHKLNALSEAHAYLMGHLVGDVDRLALRDQIGELRDAVGLENRESTSTNRKPRAGEFVAGHDQHRRG